MDTERSWLRGDVAEGASVSRAVPSARCPSGAVGCALARNVARERATYNRAVRRGALTARG